MCRLRSRDGAPVIFSVTASAASTKYIQSYYYPTKTLIGEELPYNQLSDQNGNPAQIEIGENQYTLITYWASWCPDCEEELSHLPELLPVLDEYENVQWYLVNRTDGVDDTIATASAYLKEQGTPAVAVRRGACLPQRAGHQLDPDHHPAESRG